MNPSSGSGGIEACTSKFRVTFLSLSHTMSTGNAFTGRSTRIPALSERTAIGCERFQRRRGEMHPSARRGNGPASRGGAADPGKAAVGHAGAAGRGGAQYPSIPVRPPPLPGRGMVQPSPREKTGVEPREIASVAPAARRGIFVFREVFSEHVPAMERGYRHRDGAGRGRAVETGDRAAV